LATRKQERLQLTLKIVFSRPQIVRSAAPVLKRDLKCSNSAIFLTFSRPRNMFRYILLLILLSAGFFNADIRAESAPEVLFWKRAVAEKSIGDLSAATKDRNLPGWPRVDSVNRYRSATDERLDLIKSLHEKMRQDFNSNSNLSLKNVEAYCRLAAALQAADGYSNLLLADSFNRLALFQLSGCLVKTIAPIKEIEVMWGELHAPQVQIRAFLEDLAADDESLNSHRAAFDKIDASRNVFSVLETVGIAPREVAYELMLPENQRFSRLLEKPSAIQLLLRTATTDLMVNVSLRGLIAFIERGGSYEELNPADIRQFDRRMAQTKKSFQSELLGVKSLSVNQPLSLYELHNDVQKKSAFLKIALD
jgi:hypothetical protein